MLEISSSRKFSAAGACRELTDCRRDRWQRHELPPYKWGLRQSVIGLSPLDYCHDFCMLKNASLDNC